MVQAGEVLGGSNNASQIQGSGQHAQKNQYSKFTFTTGDRKKCLQPLHKTRM